MDTDRWIRSIGKQVFIEYYSEFKNMSSQELADLLVSNGVSKDIAAANWRIGRASKIFEYNVQCEALQIIINSTRIPFSTIDQARRILEMEC